MFSDCLAWPRVSLCCSVLVWVTFCPLVTLFISLSAQAPYLVCMTPGIPLVYCVSAAEEDSSGVLWQ